jgi:hypothetical protein
MRSDEDDSKRLIRGIDFDEVYEDNESDRKLWTDASPPPVSLSRGSQTLAHYRYCGLKSHVLLAACGARERAYETEKRGDFTDRLMEKLEAGVNVSYVALMKSLPEIKG